jgi:predicted TIM-barrel fold metal-dependent hydrolase
MRRIIDAHAHIVPGYLLGKTDKRYSVTVEAYGVKRFSDDSIYQFMPDYLVDSCFSAETLIRLMSNMDIEKAILMQSPCFSLNEEVIQAVNDWPDRLRGSMVIEPWTEGCLKDIEDYHRRGLTAMKFEMSTGLGYTHPNMFPNLQFDSPLFEKIWAKAEELRMTVTIDPSSIDSPGYQVERLDRMIRKFTGLHFVICHLGFPFQGLHDNAQKHQRWQEMTSLADNKNVWFDISALPALFHEEGYPFPSAMELLHEFLIAHGAEKPIWGSDVPGTLCYGTYAQLADAFERCSLFTEEQKDRMFYQNAQEAYF